MPSLLRLLAKNRALLNSLRHTNRETSGRALTGDTEPQPVPKHVYQYHYVFDYKPEALGAFNVYAMKRDQFILEHFFMLENFDFRYEGEQWHIGSFFWNVFWFLYPVTIYLILSYDDWDSSRRKSNRNHNYQRGPSIFQEGYCLDYEPPVEDETE